MRKFVFFLFSVFLICGVVFADESESIIYSSEVSEIPSETIYETSEYILDSSFSNSDIPVISPTDIKDIDSGIVSSIRSVVSPVTPQNTSGLKSALISILGNYDPVIVEYQYQSSNGYYSYLREIQPDYVWLCSCALLIIVIYCLFKFLGGIFSGKR